MARTTSIKFPNMIDPSRNTINVVQDNASIANRCRLLVLTEPTELYNEPEFGMGLKRYLWQYNGSTVRGMMQDKLRKVFGEWEPCVIADHTELSDTLSASEDSINSAVNIEALAAAITVVTKYGDTLSLGLSADK